jgi:3',5'-cyclic-AMP phosphodiesterase
MSIHRLIQLTDCHIGESREHRLAGICTFDTFCQTLSHVASLSDKPDMIMFTGDLAAFGKPQAYELFAQQISSVSIPYAWLPGNHDDFDAMQNDGIKVPYRPLISLGDWRIIMLNSTISGQVGGTLSDGELDFLTKALHNESGHPMVIFLHHPPVAVGCRWLDPQRVSNAAEFERIVAAADNVKGIFSGHVHQEYVAPFAGGHIYTTPSTCFQFAANSTDYAMSDDYPAYRWINLQGNGVLETGVCHLALDDHKVDHQIKKY